MRGKSGHNTRPYTPFATQNPGHGCMNDLTTERGSLMYLGYFFLYLIHGCFYNQPLADVRSTSAGIEYLFSTKAVSYPPLHVSGKISGAGHLSNYSHLPLAFTMSYKTSTVVDAKHQ